MSLPPDPAKLPPAPRFAYSPRSPALPHFEDPPEDEPYAQHQPEDAVDEDETPYPEPSSEQTLLPPPNFRPFFAMVEDTTSGEHHHPYVHYVFADDDPVIVTAASMRSLGLDDTKYLPQHTPEHEERHEDHVGHEEEEEDVQVESPLPPSIPGVKEHYLIIDVGTDGRTIVDAQSLSPEWQITNTSVRTAPSFDESSPDQGFMVQVQGVEIPRKGKGKGKGQAGQDKLRDAQDKNQGDIFGALDGLVQDVEGGLQIAGKISGGRQKETEDTAGTGALVETEIKSPTGEV
ncbi:hypothetical protein IQ07DRAFT_24818 [Pyrenochaeta sp. DS3sAY3a]|nr:hypothetical protein IQ07DRAFT_24818 [Pyrenochaeta sp. DS3sAY3a]